MEYITPAYGLTSIQENFYADAEAFVSRYVRDRAAKFDENETIPRELFQQLGRACYMGINVDEEYGGKRVDNVQIGLLHLAIGTACSSVRSMLTVHGMVCEVLNRWGTPEQRSAWLPRLANGDVIAAFALTEPGAGSDAKSIATSAIKHSYEYSLTGEKQWITAGQIADVFLVFAKCDGKDTAFLVDRHASGLSVTPISGMLGLRGAMLASLKFSECRVSQEQRIGGLGFGIDAVAATALDFGRYTVAWGCLGISHACLDACVQHSATRHQFGSALREHQLVSAMLTEMIVDVRATGLVCVHAGRLRDLGEPQALWETCAAKYMASTLSVKAASNAVQIHGAKGCSGGHEAQRHYRDAKIMEIIEGSTQIQELLIARLANDSL